VVLTADEVVVDVSASKDVVVTTAVVDVVVESGAVCAGTHEVTSRPRTMNRLMEYLWVRILWL
jgi:hypothetical protein